METEVLRMEHITKVYPNGVVANSDINFPYAEVKYTHCREKMERASPRL